MLTRKSLKLAAQPKPLELSGSLQDRFQQLLDYVNDQEKRHYDFQRSVQKFLDSLNDKGALTITANTYSSFGNSGTGNGTFDNWATTHAAHYLGRDSTIAAEIAGGTTNSLLVTQNGYFDGTNWRYIESAKASNYYQNAGTHHWRVAVSGTAGNAITWVDVLQIDNKGNVVPGSAALATNATDGFTYVETCAGAPSGTPTAFTGRVPLVYDSSNNKLYAYNGAWKSVTLA